MVEPPKWIPNGLFMMEIPFKIEHLGVPHFGKPAYIYFLFSPSVRPYIYNMYCIYIYILNYPFTYRLGRSL